MNNPYQTKDYKSTFGYFQALQLMRSLDSIRVINKITFGSNTNIDQALLENGNVAFMLLTNKSKSLRNGTKAQFEYNASFETDGILLDGQGNYLYDHYDEYDEYFECPSKPLYLAIDDKTKEFMFQYEFGICIFGDDTGSLYFINLE